MNREMASIDISAFQQEQTTAANLFIAAQNIHDSGSPNNSPNLLTTANTQKNELDKEISTLTKELETLNGKIRANERDFLDGRQDNGEVVSVNTITATLQDGALSFFIFTFILFATVLTAFAFMPPLGSTQKGLYTLLAMVIIFFIIYSIIFNYA